MVRAVQARALDASGGSNVWMLMFVTVASCIVSERLHVLPFECVGLCATRPVSSRGCHGGHGQQRRSRGARLAGEVGDEGEKVVERRLSAE